MNAPRRIAEVGSADQVGDVRIVHEERVAHPVDLIGVHPTVRDVVHPAVSLDPAIDLIRERRRLLGEL